MPSHCAVLSVRITGSAAAWARPHRKRRISGGGVNERSRTTCAAPAPPVFSMRSSAIARNDALAVDVLERDRGEHRHFAHVGDEAGGEQRVAAEIGEEVGARTGSPGCRRRALPRRGAPPRSRLRGSSCSPGASPTASSAILQRLAVDLAGGQPRQGLDDLEMARDHVGRELVAQIRPDRRPVEGDARARAPGRRRGGPCPRPGAAPRPPARRPAGARASSRSRRARPGSRGS